MVRIGLLLKQYKYPRKKSLRFLIILTIVITIFNVLSSSILPKDIFLVYASEINAGELVNLVNAERLSIGLDVLTVDSRLVTAAKEKGNDMLAKNYWAHYGPNGESPWQFIIASGYDYSYAGENLAKDFSSTVPIHSAWMASPTHRSNILNPNFENIGVATVTGNFQGKETTIVVQMFGATKNEEMQNEEGKGIFIPNLGIGNLSPPLITDPHDGDILNDGAFSIRGEAENGNKVEIYDLNEKIGESSLVSGLFTFKKGTRYSEGRHIVYAQVKDDLGGFSSASKTVSIIVDTIPPMFLEDTARFKYGELGVNGRKYIFSIKIADNPVKVQGEYLNKEFLCNQKGDNWECEIQVDSQITESLKLFAQDAAGNKAEKTISQKVLAAYAQQVSYETTSTPVIKKWFVENVFSRIMTRTLRGQLNLFIVLIMLVLLSFEWIFLAKTGFTKGNKASLIQLPVFALLLFISILGGGGQIL